MNTWAAHLWLAVGLLLAVVGQRVRAGRGLQEGPWTKGAGEGRDLIKDDRRRERERERARERGEERRVQS